jgi:pyruvate formate lyase activating enzyme
LNLLNSLIFDIRRYSIHDGPGIRTTIFLKGCPLRCWWCQNPESQEGGVDQITVQKVLDGKSFESELAVGSWQLAEDIMKEIDKDAVFYEESGGGVTFSGGEPLMQAEALQELLELCREKGYHTTIDTCGHAEPAALHRVMELADLWLFDLKLMDNDKHVEFTSVSNELALKNLETLALAGKNIFIRFPFIPGINDGTDNLEAVAKLMIKLGLKQIDILPYHAFAKDKYRRIGKTFLLEGVKEPDKEKVDEVINFFVIKGILVGISGG